MEIPDPIVGSFPEKVNLGDFIKTMCKMKTKQTKKEVL